MIQYLNKDNFLKTVKAGPVVLVDFYADWCGPCQAIAPVLEELATEFEGKAIIAKVDVDKEQELAGVFNIRSIPTMILFKDGEPEDIIVGLQTKTELVKKISNHLQEVEVA
ncbi:MAG: thioredoxin [Ekhidna sp.]|nr:thioredoxin [Ekhidna sp.]